MIGEGLIAWMRAWQDPLVLSCSSPPNRSVADHYPTESWQQEATRLLVNMALGHLKL